MNKLQKSTLSRIPLLYPSGKALVPSNITGGIHCNPITQQAHSFGAEATPDRGPGSCSIASLKSRAGSAVCRGNPNLHNRHAILSQGPSFVGAHCSGRPHRFTRIQMLHQILLLIHLIHCESQGHGNRERQPLGNSNTQDGDADNEAIDKIPKVRGNPSARRPDDLCRVCFLICLPVTRIDAARISHEHHLAEINAFPILAQRLSAI
mmetsp:Transcript_16251/g.35832  ORF Transcript_16251/g.35832 Transcript_16251/m.35832 type:complete len:207 (-) Transcript_16251:553-1173(-)